MKSALQVLVVMVLTALLAVGCGGGGEEASSSSESAPAPKAESPGTDISMYSGTVSGTINFTGTAPKPRKMNLDDACSALHTADVLSQAVIINDNNTLKNVFIYVKEGLGDRKYDPPTIPVVFDQVGCTYEPHVFGVQVNQPIKILNSDPMLHNIHARAKVNRPFNFGMPKKGDERERSFKKSEVMVFIKCDVHPWMGAYCGVLDHPYYAVSDGSGSFAINNLPAGDYVIEAWHEEYGTQTQNVTVADNETKTVDFSYAN